LASRPASNTEPSNESKPLKCARSRRQHVRIGFSSPDFGRHLRRRKVRGAACEPPHRPPGHPRSARRGTPAKRPARQSCPVGSIRGNRVRTRRQGSVQRSSSPFSGSRASTPQRAVEVRDPAGAQFVQHPCSVGRRGGGCGVDRADRPGPRRRGAKPGLERPGPRQEGTEPGLEVA
jgi:hypothetical protein